MERNINDYTDGFRLKYEQFVNTSDAAEAEGLWDEAEYGEMEGYFFSIIMGVILHLIKADGTVDEEEVDYLNRNFGYSYTVGEVVDLYDSMGEEIERNWLENAKAGLELLRKMDEELAREYLELLSQICDIISISDREAEEAEVEELRRLYRAV